MIPLTEWEHELGVLTRIPLGRLKHSNGVIRQVEEDYEPAVQVNRSGSVHASHKPQHIAVQPMTISLHELLEIPVRQKLQL